MKKVLIYDSTLRDGAQAQGISFSVEDKIRLVKKLDKLGANYIEAGNPGSNPKDLEFFERIKNMSFKNAKVIAFGSTRRVNISVEDDANVNSLLKADTPAIAIFGKSWDFHVTDIFKSRNKEVVFDAEHFFDGYKANPEYAMKSLKAAFDAGADCLCLCDTNGGSFPNEVFEITQRVVNEFNVDVGIHCHNDTGMAVANSIMAVQAGAKQVQGTLNGFGERSGNANLCTIIPNLQLKLGYSCIPEENMKHLTAIARYASEVANVVHDERAPYVGKNSFAHKAGMHADAVHKNTTAYEHISPESVGNERVFLMSEVAGRSAVLNMINHVDSTITKDSPETKLIIEKLKEMEFKGYQYEGAESSFELIIRKMLGKYKSFFELQEFKVVVNEPSVTTANSSAMIKIKVGDQEEITADEGDGPVNALDKALRKALVRFYPQVMDMKLTDYKVRVLDSKAATASKVRVLIESTDSEEVWTTIGVSTDIIEASWHALVDSIEYKLLKHLE